MKKPVVLIIGFFIIAAVFLFTFEKPLAQSPDKTILLWHSYRGGEQAALETLVKVWNNAHPEMMVLPLALPHDAYANKLTSAIPRGQGPDVFIFAHERIGDWADSHLIEPIDNLISTDLLKSFTPNTVKAFQYGGQLYGVPLAYKSVALIYNKAMIPTPPKTTDQMIQIMTTIPARHPGAFGLAYEAGSFYHHGGWLFGFGGKIFDDKGELLLNSPENAASFDFVADLTKRGLLPKEPTSVLVSQLFNQGKCAMVINGPWFLGEIDPSIDFGVAPMPVVSKTGRPALPFLTVEGAIISSRAKNEKGAMAFALFLATGSGARTRLETGKQLVTFEEIYHEPFINIDPALLGFKEQAENSVPMPNTPKMRAVWEPAAIALRSVLRGSENSFDALNMAQQRLGVFSRPAPNKKNWRPYLAIAAGLAFCFLVGAIIFIIRKRLFGEIARAKHAYLYLFPAAAAMLLLVFVPFIVGTAVAFFAHRGGEFTFVGFAHFINILTCADSSVTDPLSFYFTLGITVLWTAVNVALHVSIGIALAMVLRNQWLKLRGIYRVLLIVPWAVPNYITALIWKSMFHGQFGAINGFLKFLGLEPVSWFSNFWTSFAANVATNTWLGFPFMMVVCLGALQAIPRDLEEAAMMDGAGWWTRFTKVILPLIKPALVPAVILGSVWTFNMFNIIYLVSGGEPDGATEILISEAYRWAFTRQEQYGYAAAYATLIFIALIFYSLGTKKLTGEAETT